MEKEGESKGENERVSVRENEGGLEVWPRKGSEEKWG